MDWKKGQFLITISDGGEIKRQYVKGVTSTIYENSIGVHKNENADWNVTDISTGLCLHVSSTQKAAKEWAEDNSEMIDIILNKPVHDRYVRMIERCSVEQ